MSNLYTHYRTCNLCEAMCGLEIQVEDKQVLTIKGDKADPFSRGHICPKAVGLKDIYEDQDRLKYPIRKTANGWEQMEWEAAFDYVAAQLKGVQQKYGDNAVGVYQGNPNVHNFGTMVFGPNFVRSLKTSNRFSATSADQLPHHFAALQMFGHASLLPIPDIDHTDYLLIMGGNPLVSNGSIMTAPDIGTRLRAISGRGGKVVVLDPRRTETAQRADEHHFILPETDALCLLAIIHVIFEERWENLGQLADFTEGLAEIRSLALAYAPEVVAAETGISPETIRQIAKNFSQAERAVCYGRLGVSTQLYGGLCLWLVNVLNIISGNFDQPGGAMFPLPAFDQIGMFGKKGKALNFNRWQSRVRGLPEFAGELPVACLAEELLTPGEGQIKALVTIAGNPVLSIPNGKQLEKALDSLDFMLAIDIYLNETTCHADVILPPTTGLEVSHYDIVFHSLAIRNTAKYSSALFEKEANQRHDWEIFKALTKRMGGTAVPAQNPEQVLAFGLQSGPYAPQGLTFEQIVAQPHGIDLGPLQPCLPGRLFTTDQRIQLAPAIFLNDLERLNQQNHEKTAGFPLKLIGRRHLRSNNSWMHNVYRLVKGRDRCTLLMHPNDADKLEIKPEQLVNITSRAGTLTIKVELSDEIMPGVVSMPHGWGHDRSDTRLTVAAEHPGLSLNDLTDEHRIDSLTGNAAFNGVPVKVVGVGN
ncbi:MAG: molybdopterin-dependent oxidoreductase [Saprospiraceae bacterium]